MLTGEQNGRFYEFDAFRIDVVKRVLLRAGEPVTLKPKTFETLLALVEHAGHVITKDELMGTLWPDTAVEEANLTQHVSLARKALGDSTHAPRYILTHYGRGYQFVGEVRERGDDGGTRTGEAAALLQTDGAGAGQSGRDSPPPVFVASGVKLGTVARARRWLSPRKLLATLLVVGFAGALGYVLYVRRVKPADRNRPALAEAGLAWDTWRVEWDWEGADRHFRRALELDPNNERIHRSYSIFLMSEGRSAEGMAEAQRAVELSPDGIDSNYFLAAQMIYARRYDDAIAQSNKTLALAPNLGPAYGLIGEAYTFKEMYPEAFGALQKGAAMEEISKQNILAILGYAYAAAGKRDEALATLAELQKMAKQDRASSGSIAVVYVGLGDNEQAFAYLNKAYQEHDWWVSTLKVHPVFDKIRTDPRFDALLRRIRLNP